MVESQGQRKSEETEVETVRPWYVRLLQCVKGYIIKPK